MESQAMQNRYLLWSLRILTCAALLTSSVAQSLPRMPSIEGDSLAGRKVGLPDAAAGKIAVLVFGFTKASKNQTSAWATRLQTDVKTRADIELYQLPVLESVPRLVRGMVISGIRKGVSENQRDHFVPILQGEADLKQLVGYKEPDDAYLLLLDRAGNILHQMHGAPDDSNYERLRTAIDSALNPK